MVKQNGDIEHYIDEFKLKSIKRFLTPFALPQPLKDEGPPLNNGKWIPVD